MNKKKESKLPKSDLETWKEYIKNPNDISDKDINIKKSSTSSHYKFDLHGYSLTDANNKAKEVLLYCSEKKIREVLLITGKGLHSKTDSVYESDKFSKLKYSVPDFLMSNTETSDLISNIKIADADKGGEGAIVVKLKKL